MYITQFDVKYRKIYPKDIIKYTGIYNVDTFKFNFDEEWNGLVKTLTLIVGDNTYNVPLINDEAIVPKEAYGTNQRISIGLYGIDSNKILASELITLIISEGAYKEGQEPSNLPTPTQWDLYVVEINRLLNEANATKEECEKILTDLDELSKQAISEMESIKDEVNQTVEAFDKNAEEKLKDYNSNAEEKENNINDIAKDVRDMASAITFATFDVEPTTGELYVNSAESLGNMGFSVEKDGAMYVEIPNKEVS